MVSAIYMISAVLFVMPLLFPFSLASSTRNAAQNIGITISKDLTLLCSLSKGLPEGFVSKDVFLTLQIIFRHNSGREMVAASAFGYGETNINKDFGELAPQATVKGSTREGFLEFTMQNLTYEILGTYLCMAVKLDSGRYITYNRALTIGQHSSGLLLSQVDGFQAMVLNYCHVRCGTGSSCLCSKTFRVNLLVTRAGEQLSQQTCADIARLQCESDWNKQASVKESMCYLLTKCGGKSIQLNCIADLFSLINQNLNCDHASPPHHETNKNKTQTKITKDISTSGEEQACDCECHQQQHIYWLVPATLFIGAFGVIVFQKCSTSYRSRWLKQPPTDALQATDSTSTQKSGEDEDEEQEQPAEPDSDIISDGSRASIPTDDAHSTSEALEDARLAATAVFFKKRGQKDRVKRSFNAEEEEGFIAIQMERPV